MVSIQSFPYKSYAVFIWSQDVFHTVSTKRNPASNRRDPGKGGTKISTVKQCHHVIISSQWTCAKGCDYFLKKFAYDVLNEQNAVLEKVVDKEELMECIRCDQVNCVSSVEKNILCTGNRYCISTNKVSCYQHTLYEAGKKYTNK